MRIVFFGVRSSRMCVSKKPSEYWTSFHLGPFADITAHPFSPSQRLPPTYLHLNFFLFENAEWKKMTEYIFQLKILNWLIFIFGSLKPDLKFVKSVQKYFKRNICSPVVSLQTRTVWPDSKYCCTGLYL